jgi:hypothetical protein
MSIQMTIYFDSEKTRQDFFEDIGECILWNDHQRDADLQHHYEVSTAYEFPDLDHSLVSATDVSSNHLTYEQASRALNPMHPVYALSCS